MERGYCLSGEVGGAHRLFRILPGSNQVGSHPENRIVLPDLGVSRVHAEIHLDEGQLRICDRSSTNGTFVNGEKVTEAVLAAGDQVRLGPVELAIVPRDDEDLSLAFTLELDLKGHSAELPQSPTDLLPSSQAAPATDLVEIFTEHLQAGGVDPLAAVLGALAKARGFTKSAIVFWDGQGRPAPMAVLGDPDLGVLPRSCGPLFEGAKAAATRAEFWHLTALEGDSVNCAIHAEAGSVPLGLVVAGGELDPADGPALRTLLRLASLLRRGAGSLGNGASPQPSLAFPEGVVAGRSEAMASLYRQMRSLVRGRMPILLLGETGVGKEHLAHTLHRSSDRSTGPFVAINCAAIPADLLEAEMFGIASGVATGVKQRLGRFQQADGGTLFLDEADSMTAALQAKLLRALEDKEVQPVGGKARRVDVRIVAATNGDLPALIEEGLFRRDLYYRLAGYELHVPALRQRRQDIPLLVEHFVRTFCHEAGKSIQGMSLAAMEELARRPWPGNVRELRHVIRRLVYFCVEGDVIRRSDLPRLDSEAPLPLWVEELVDGAEQLDLREILDQVEAELIRLALRRTEGNKAAAARFLGVSRNGVRIKLDRLGLSGSEE